MVTKALLYSYSRARFIACRRRRQQELTMIHPWSRRIHHRRATSDSSNFSLDISVLPGLCCVS